MRHNQRVLHAEKSTEFYHKLPVKASSLTVTVGGREKELRSVKLKAQAHKACFQSGRPNM